MNKTIKIALCISLVGIGVFVWTQVASAGKPLPPPTAPVVVTFLSGDVSAAPQTLPGPFTATIDFLRYIPYLCSDTPAGSEELLRMLQTKNPITYESLSITVSRIGTHTLNFKVQINGVPYTIQMNLFSSDTTESTPTLDTVHLREGRFAIMSGNKPGRYVLFAGEPTKPVNLDFSMTK